MPHHSLGCRRCKKGVCRYGIFSPFCHRCHSGRVFLERPPTFWGHCNCRKTANLAVRSTASQGGPSTCGAGYTLGGQDPCLLNSGCTQAWFHPFLFTLSCGGISLIGVCAFCGAQHPSQGAGLRGRGGADWPMGLRQEPADLTSLSQTYMSKQ